MKLRLTLRLWWKSLLILAIVALIITGIITITAPANTFFQVLNGFSTVVASLATLLTAIGWLDKKAQRLLFLSQQVRNQVPTEAKSAMSQLSAEGFLFDGSLRGTNFSGTLLSGAEIEYSGSGGHKGANLEKVDFSDAKLNGALMRDANLYKANLKRADLTYAQLINANLSNANLEGADLSGANLSKANLSGANIAGTTFSEETTLPNVKRWTETTDLHTFGIVDEYDNNIDQENQNSFKSLQNESDRVKRLRTENNDGTDIDDDEPSDTDEKSSTQNRSK